MLQYSIQTRQSTRGHVHTLLSGRGLLLVPTNRSRPLRARLPPAPPELEFNVGERLVVVPAVPAVMWAAPFPSERQVWFSIGQVRSQLFTTRAPREPIGRRDSRAESPVPPPPPSWSSPAHTTWWSRIDGTMAPW